jgi:hypothetical protein
MSIHIAADSNIMGAENSPSAIVSAEFEVFGKVQGSYHTHQQCAIYKLIPSGDRFISLIILGIMVAASTTCADVPKRFTLPY